MTDEDLLRLYNIGWFQRSVGNAPSHYVVEAELDNGTVRMKLSELEQILRANADRVTAIRAQQEPITIKKVIQPYANLRRVYA